MPESANVRKLPSAAAPEDVPRAPEPLPVKPAGELLPAIREDGKVSMVRRESEETTGASNPELAKHLLQQAACGSGATSGSTAEKLEQVGAVCAQLAPEASSGKPRFHSLV